MEGLEFWLHGRETSPLRGFRLGHVLAAMPRPAIASEMPLLVNSSAAILRDVLCQKQSGRLPNGQKSSGKLPNGYKWSGRPEKVRDCDCRDNRVL